MQDQVSYRTRDNEVELTINYEYEIFDISVGTEQDAVGYAWYDLEEARKLRDFLIEALPLTESDGYFIL